MLTSTFEFSLASGAAVNLNAEHPLQALRPSHSRMTGNGGLLVANPSFSLPHFR